MLLINTNPIMQSNIPIKFAIEIFSLKNIIPMGINNSVTDTFKTIAPKLISYPTLYARRNPNSNKIIDNPRAQLVQFNPLNESIKSIFYDSK